MITELVKNLKTDPGLYYVYQSNIAMAFKDNMHWAASVTYKDGNEVEKYEVTPEQLHQIANDAAKHFLNLLCRES